jgi:hypothetical protein
MAKGQWGRALTDDIVIVVVMARAAEPSMRPRGPRDSPVLASLPTAKTQLQGANKESLIVPIKEADAPSTNDVAATPLSLLTAKMQLQGSEFLQRYQN